MMAYTIYVLCRRRTAKEVQRFLDAFLRQPRISTEEFWFPQYVDHPESVFRDPFELMAVLERERQQPYSLYWNEGAVDSSSADDKVTNVMVFFTDDGQLIAGCDVWSDAPQIVLERACRVAGAEYGFVTGDEPPPSNSEDFIKLCEQAEPPTMVKGVFNFNRMGRSP